MSDKTKVTPRLVIVDGKDKGTIIFLKNGTTILGRSKGDFIIHDPRMSRSHVAIHFDAAKGQLSFNDLKSLNGTFINSEKTGSGKLEEGDQIQLGDTVIDCQLYPHEYTGSVSLSKDQFLSRSYTGRNEPALTSSPSIPHAQTSSDLPESIELEAHSELEDDSRQKTSTQSLATEENDEVTSSPANEPPPSQSLLSRFRNFSSSLLNDQTTKNRRVALLSILLVFGIFYLYSNSSPDAVVQNELSEIGKLEKQGKIQEAIAKTVDLKSRYPESFEVYMHLGRLYSVINRNELAILAFQKAKKIRPGDADTHLRLLRVYIQTGLVSEANLELKAIDDLINSWSDDTEIVANARLIYEVAQITIEHPEVSQSSQGATIVAKALQNSISPNSPIGYKLEAKVLFQKKQPKRALQILEKARGLAAQDEWIIENIVLAKFSIGDIPGAINSVNDWLALRSDSTKALLTMSYLKFRVNQEESALEHLQKLLNIASKKPDDPHFAEALNLTGRVYLAANRKKEGVRFIREACVRGFSSACKNPLLKNLRIPQSNQKKSSTNIGSSWGIDPKFD